MIFLPTNNGSALVFSNLKVLTHKLLPSIDTKLGKAKIRPDGIHAQSSLQEEEKIGPTNIFCYHIKVDGFYP